MSDPIERELAVFGAARRLPAEARAAYLDGACGGDAGLRQCVEELLRAGERAGAFLQEPAPGAQRPQEAGNPPRETPGVGEKAGDRIGRYKLLEQIGEGGCGVVFMAGQEEPIRRRVALKVIKLGMDTKQVIARFEAERQALALMDHPNIARVLDAGASETGRPYFVMELVRGVKLTSFCDENELSTEERLRLFLQVCHAIQHAHQKGVIHRDIKPSNILVTVNDGQPVPKVIDFGIAKATAGRLTDETLFTAFEQFIGTPAYMSPEQAAMTSVDIDTRSDIYSLGVLLYELLAGQPPFDPQRLLQAGREGIRDVLQQEEPPRPSARLSTLDGKAQTRIAKHRQTEPPRLISLIRGDLDWIAMKALEKDRSRRYETANALAMDIERHLKQEPVLARPPSAAYRFQKLVRRNKLVFAAAGAVAGALLIGLGLSTWLLFKERATLARALTAEKAQSQSRRQAEAEGEFLKNMIRGISPSAVHGWDTRLLKVILDQAAVDVGNQFNDLPEVEAELRSTLGDGYRALGQYTNAEGMHRTALAIRRRLWGNSNTNVAHSLDAVAQSLRFQGKTEESEPLFQEALTIRTNLLGLENPEVATSLWQLGVQRSRQNRLAEAEDLLTRALALRRRFLGTEHADVADVLFDLSEVLVARDKPSEAEKMAREALVIRRKQSGGKDFFGEAAMETGVGVALRIQGKLQEAETVFRQAFELQRRKLGADHPFSCESRIQLAYVLKQEGKLPEAEKTARECLPLAKQLPDSFDHAVAWTVLGETIYKAGRLLEAEAAFRQALPIFEQQTFPVQDEHVVRGELVRVLCDEKKFAEAKALYREGITAQRRISTQAARQREARMLTGLADFLRDRGKPADAESIFREGLVTGKNAGSGDELLEVMVRYGDLLLAQSRMAEAESLCREGLALCRERGPNDFELHERLQGTLAKTLMAQGRSTEAETVLEENVRLGKKFGVCLGLVNALGHLGDLRRDQGKPAEAEACYREALQISGGFYQEGSQRSQWLSGGLATVLKAEGKLSEAEDLLRLLPKQAQAAILVAQGDAYGRQAKWQQAIQCYNRAIELEPTNQFSYLKLAAALAFTGGTTGHSKLCRQTLNQFAASREPVVCENAAKACLMLPCSGGDPLTISNWAQIAVTVPGPDWLRPWAELLRGHVEYRIGHFAEALRWEQKVVSEIDPNPARDVQTHCIVAMAQHRLKHGAEARIALAKAAEITRTRLPQSDSDDLGESWWDYLLAQMLLREAQALIDPAHAQQLAR